MKDLEIIKLAKVMFGLFFLMGSLFLLGAFITNQDEFAAAGYMLLIFGVPINLLCVFGLLIYGIVYRSKLKDCLMAICILAINIPIAVVYTLIGISLF
ncbi:hypothetical protein GCM10023210_25780 [Chryseobacterium ginsengisoli]|uniref:Branched-chain amino acid:cation transporter, LIVCS family n=1 Tax=Chryseobacterium ginsengisoli TaxID=363853 RepID=A0ABP9MER1_9FLAO